MPHDDEAGHEHVPAPHDHDGDRSFDARAATWDDPAKVERARLVADAIVAATGSTSATSLFEYGAGTGLVFQSLGDRVGPAVLADTSAGMRAEMAKKVADGRLDARTRIVGTDLDSTTLDRTTLDRTTLDRTTLDSTTTLDEAPFDLVVTVLTLHHVDDPGRVLQRFAEMTSAGGHVCIVDLDAEDGSFHGDGFGGHHGFDRDELAGLMRAAGLVDIDVSDCGSIRRDDGEYSMFLAVGRSAS